MAWLRSSMQLPPSRGPHAAPMQPPPIRIPMQLPCSHHAATHPHSKSASSSPTLMPIGMPARMGSEPVPSLAMCASSSRACMGGFNEDGDERNRRHAWMSRHAITPLHANSSPPPASVLSPPDPSRPAASSPPLTCLRVSSCPAVVMKLCRVGSCSAIASRYCRATSSALRLLLRRSAWMDRMTDVAVVADEDGEADAAQDRPDGNDGDIVAVFVRRRKLRCRLQATRCCMSSSSSSAALHRSTAMGSKDQALAAESLSLGTRAVLWIRWIVLLAVEWVGCEACMLHTVNHTSIMQESCRPP